MTFFKEAAPTIFVSLENVTTSSVILVIRKKQFYVNHAFDKFNNNKLSRKLVWLKKMKISEYFPKFVFRKRETNPKAYILIQYYLLIETIPILSYDFCTINFVAGSHKNWHNRKPLFLCYNEKNNFESRYTG